MAEWVRWQLDFCVMPKVAGSSPLAAELFLPPKEKQNFLQIRFFLKNFYRNTYLGVKNHEESEFDVKKFIGSLKQLKNVLFDKNFNWSKSQFLSCFNDSMNFFNVKFRFLVIFYP